MFTDMLCFLQVGILMRPPERSCAIPLYPPFDMYATGDVLQCFAPHGHVALLPASSARIKQKPRLPQLFMAHEVEYAGRASKGRRTKSPVFACRYALYVFSEQVLLLPQGRHGFQPPNLRFPRRRMHPGRYHHRG